MLKSVTLLLLFIIHSSMVSARVTDLSGAGATFPEPLYTALFAEYQKLTGVRVNYQGIGSGGGIRQIINKTIDFGATDIPLNEQELKEIRGKVVQIPVCIGNIAVSYHVPGLTNSLRLTPKAISLIFQGKINKWSDKALLDINPGVKLPDIPIIVVRRSDSSGSTYLFTHFLSATDADWKTNVGASKVLKWPVGIGAIGNAGVAQYIKKIPGSIGYIELTYVLQAEMPTALIQNQSGAFIAPLIQNVYPYLESDTNWGTLSGLIKQDRKGAYPISSFTWIIIYQEQKYAKRSEAKARELLNLLWWMIHEGQSMNKLKDYRELPIQVRVKAEDLLKTVVYDGKKILK